MYKLKSNVIYKLKQTGKSNVVVIESTAFVTYKDIALIVFMLWMFIFDSYPAVNWQVTLNLII